MSHLQPDQKSSKIEISELNLPKGGGTISGISNNFSTNEFTGSAGFSIAIEASPCREVTPSLTLAYNSGNGNSAFGLGWSINVSSITRKTNKGIPEYNHSDVFLLDGDELILHASRKEDVYTVRSYIKHHEGEFSLIEYFCNDKEVSECFWKVTSANHLISIYGKNKNARLFDLSDEDRIYAWHLEEVYTPQGDHQVYDYKRDQSATYLSSIYYGNQTPSTESFILKNSPELTDASNWHFEVIFDYGERDVSSTNESIYQPLSPWNERLDSFSNYTPGFEIRTERLCCHILMFHRFKEINKGVPVLATSYQLSYDEKSTVTLLENVTKIGYYFTGELEAPYQHMPIPPLSFDYSEFDPSNGSCKELLHVDGEPPNQFDSQNYHHVDLGAKGLSGILNVNEFGTWYAPPERPINSSTGPSKALNKNFFRDGIELGNWKLLEKFPSGVNYQHIFTDVTGSGSLDLVINEPEIRGFWDLEKKTPFQTFEKTPNIDQSFEGYVDMTGDGLADFVAMEDRLIRIYPSLKERGYDEPILAELPQSLPFLNDSQTESIQFQNMAGGGLSQLVHIKNGSIRYWPNFGLGNFGDLVEMKNVPDFGKDFNINQLHIADLDGSGTEDLIYVNSTKFTIWINQSGNSFSAPQEFELPFQFDRLDQIHFADINGKGVQSLILSTIGDQDLKPQKFYFDFCRSKKPYLLSSSTNNMGARTEITYNSSVDYCLQDENNGTGWVTKLPFPLQVVSKVKVIDEVTKSNHSTYYSYHHGFYDGEEREFKGFGRIESQQEEYFSTGSSNNPNYSAPTKTVSWYNLGVPESLSKNIKQQYLKEFYAGDNQGWRLDDTYFDDNIPIKQSDINRLQAFQALSGTVIRTEIYGLDDSVVESTPYQVHEFRYNLKLIQKVKDKQKASFQLIKMEDLSHNYERDSQDPMIHHEMVLDTDQFGNELLSAAIAYPRRQVKNALKDQQNLVITCANTSVNTPVLDPEGYLHSVPYESKNYELASSFFNSSKLLTIGLVKKKIDAWIDNKEPNYLKLIRHQKHFFAQIKDGITLILEEGKVCLPVLPVKNSVLTYSDEQLKNEFKGKVEDLHLELKRGLYEQDKNGNWWNPGLTSQFLSLEGFYLPAGVNDPTDNHTSYEYDKYYLINTKITNALGYTSKVSKLDYQHLIPLKMIDANQNVVEVQLDTLGQVVRTSSHGTQEGSKKVGFQRELPVWSKPTEKNLDQLVLQASEILADAQSFFHYDLFAWLDKKEPIYNLSISSNEYPINGQLPKDEKLIISIARSDGFGRVLETKTRVEANIDGRKLAQGDSSCLWQTSGRAEYNNKGLPVRKWEPYFSGTDQYVDDHESVKMGTSAILYYDPLGRNNKTITDKGFLTKKEWNAWKITSYDSNDSLTESPYWQENIVQSKNSPEYQDDIIDDEVKRLKQIAKTCKNTPSQMFLDNLGNAIVHRQILRSPKDDKIEVLDTMMTYDVLGRQLTNIDPRLLAAGKPPNFQYTYGYTEKPLKTVSADAGTSYALDNIFGNPLFGLDSRGTRISLSYDELHRPTTKRVHNPTLKLDQTTERMLYGEEINGARNLNLIGKLHKSWDESGSTTYLGFDILGNLLKIEKAPLKNYKNKPNWNDIKNEALMESFQRSMKYDAGGRLLEEVDPEGTISKSEYWTLGQLKSLIVTHANNQKEVHYVKSTSYNEKNQRTAVRYGNNVLTNYTYDKWTGALIDIKSSCKGEGDKTKLLQHEIYTYDAVGNVIQKEDLSENTIWFNNQEIKAVNTYSYDSLYRLKEATGRQLTNSRPAPNDSWNGMLPQYQGKNISQVENYLEKYNHDHGGNLCEIVHRVKGNSQDNYTTKLVVADDNNRAIKDNMVREKKIEPEEVNQFFDNAGNQISTGKIMDLSWNYRNNISMVDFKNSKEEEKRNKAYYTYDGHGNRMRKIFEDKTGTQMKISETIYLGDLEIHKKYVGDIDPDNLIEEFHVMAISDGAGIIARKVIWIKGKPPAGTATSTTFYQLQNMLDSVNILLDEKGELLHREEFTPYGQTCYEYDPGKVAHLKTYRYSSKELDKQTGFYYYGMRYYQTSLGRWLSADPAGKIDGLNLYAFVNGNPMTRIDFYGLTGSNTKDKKSTSINPKQWRSQARTLRDIAEKPDYGTSANSHGYNSPYSKIVSHPGLKTKFNYPKEKRDKKYARVKFDDKADYPNPLNLAWDKTRNHILSDHAIQDILITSKAFFEGSGSESKKNELKTALKTWMGAVSGVDSVFTEFEKDIKNDYKTYRALTLSKVNVRVGDKFINDAISSSFDPILDAQGNETVETARIKASTLTVQNLLELEDDYTIPATFNGISLSSTLANYQDIHESLDKAIGIDRASIAKMRADDKRQKAADRAAKLHKQIVNRRLNKV